jgi:hypothetical protein
MSKHLVRGVAIASAIAVALPPPPLFAQSKLPAAAEATASEFNVEQLDAMLAPIALYPDELLAVTLMASTYPLQVVAAARWLEKDSNKSLKRDALEKALQMESYHDTQTGADSTRLSEVLPTRFGTSDPEYHLSTPLEPAGLASTNDANGADRAIRLVLSARPLPVIREINTHASGARACALSAIR